MFCSTLGIPPPSPCPSNVDDILPIIITEDLGMIADDEVDNQEKLSLRNATRKQRPPRKHVSKHFQAVLPPIVTTPPKTPPKPRIVHGVNIDAYSSDSSLSSVPTDLESESAFPELASKSAKVQAIKVRRPTKSPYFPNTTRPKFLSCLPFPPLTETTFGLMQERLAHDPFRLLIATIFLNKTPGERAMPVFYQLMQEYPTIAELANADVTDVVSIIHKLGFQNQRARKCITMAKKWLEQPPAKGRRYRKINYPAHMNGRDVAVDEAIEDDDPRIAWEVSHLPGLGPYSHDSWRMFCRDKLRGLSSGWLGEDAAESFEPEWKRVVPT